MSNNTNANYFLELLKLAAPNTVSVDGSDYSCVGSSYYYSTQPQVSTLSAILKGKVLANVGITAKYKSVIGIPMKEEEPATEYLNDIKIMPKIAEAGNKIQKLFDDNVPKETKFNPEIANKIIQDYKAAQGEIKDAISNIKDIELKGAGSLKVRTGYSPANIYVWNLKELGCFDVSFEGDLKPKSTITENTLKYPIIKLACNSAPDNFTVSVEGVGSIEKNGDNFDIFLEKN
ncbi:MAG: hypothetical protein WA139_04935 [Candidatus Aenigmatarchaeota archaeon]